MIWTYVDAGDHLPSTSDLSRSAHVPPSRSPDGHGATCSDSSDTESTPSHGIGTQRSPIEPSSSPSRISGAHNASRGHKQADGSRGHSRLNRRISGGDELGWDDVEAPYCPPARSTPSTSTATAHRESRRRGPRSESASDESPEPSPKALKLLQGPGVMTNPESGGSTSQPAPILSAWCGRLSQRQLTLTYCFKYVKSGRILALSQCIEYPAVGSEPNSSANASGAGVAEPRLGVFIPVGKAFILDPPVLLDSVWDKIHQLRLLKGPLAYLKGPFARRQEGTSIRPGHVLVPWYLLHILHNEYKKSSLPWPAFAVNEQAETMEKMIHKTWNEQCVDDFYRQYSREKIQLDLPPPLDTNVSAPSPSSSRCSPSQVSRHRHPFKFRSSNENGADGSKAIWLYSLICKREVRPSSFPTSFPAPMPNPVSKAMDVLWGGRFRNYRLHMRAKPPTQNAIRVLDVKFHPSEHKKQIVVGRMYTPYELFLIDFHSRPIALTQLCSAQGTPDVQYSAKGGYIVSGHYSGCVTVWSDTGRRLFSLGDNGETHRGQVTRIATHPSMEHITASCGEDGKVFIWDIEKGVCQGELRPRLFGPATGFHSVSDMEFVRSPRHPERLLVSRGDQHSGVLQIYDIEYGEQALLEMAYPSQHPYLASPSPVSKTFNNYIYSVQTSPHTSDFVLSCSAEQVVLSSMKDLSEIKTFRFPKSKRVTGAAQVWSAAFSPDEQLIQTAWTDNFVRVYDIRNLEQPLAHLDHGNIPANIPDTNGQGVNVAEWTSNGHCLVTGSCRGDVTVWDLKNGQSQKQVIGVVGSNVTTIAVSSNDSFIASGNETGECALFEFSEGV
eukprot:CAMPEP_0184646220 /NCGR_PEP_ID=MMETSP0308-20130426/2874_1 /TAXON_ID=38269 /ORGANISM="Gloeochaete witrockiana, Strain SAG 46.84" /LENGTH=836 /DNA_ID=CAMNT_0027076017 /DNA_START=94 /DNA_END=2605 /DNA_ORIENTATION=-